MTKLSKEKTFIKFIELVHVTVLLNNNKKQLSSIEISGEPFVVS